MKLLAMATAATLLVGGCGMSQTGKIGLGTGLVIAGSAMIALEESRTCSADFDQGFGCSVGKDTVPVLGAAVAATGALVLLAGVAHNGEGSR